MDLFNFGRDQLAKGQLNNLLGQVGIDDVGSFVSQFRDQASSSNQISSGGSFLNQFTGGNHSAGQIQGAMKAYQMFSGNQGGGGFLGNMGSTVQNAQQMYAMYKQFDKNGDGTITVDDIDIYLKEMGLGFVSPRSFTDARI